MLCAWEAAVGRTTTQQNTEAEQRTARPPGSHPRRHVRHHARSLGITLEAGQTLPLSFLEWRIAQADDGEFLTESLADVANQQEERALNEDTTADFVREGNKAVVRMRRVRVRSAMPQTTEQLRHKYRLLAVH